MLRDNRASRNHARIQAENGEYYIEDLKSSHGVFVNGTRVTRQKLYAADRIEFGFPDSYSLIFTFDDDEIQKLLDQFSAPKTASAGAGNLAKLRALVEVARALQNSLSTDDVLSAVVDAALAITGFERGFLLLNDARRLARTTRPRPARQSGPESRNRRAARKHPEGSAAAARVAVDDLLSPQSADFEPHAEPEDDSRSVVGVPLVRVRAGSQQETCIITSRSDTIGVIYLDSRQTAVDLSSGNRELLQTLALEASTILENARLLEEERIKHRMEEELSIAREIQTSLLPRRLPSDGWFRVAGSSIPSHEVGGDCFDVRQISPDAWSLVVTDVSGKGVSSALAGGAAAGKLSDCVRSEAGHPADDEPHQPVSERAHGRREVRHGLLLHRERRWRGALGKRGTLHADSCAGQRRNRDSGNDRYAARHARRGNVRRPNRCNCGRMTKSLLTAMAYRMPRMRRASSSGLAG